MSKINETITHLILGAEVLFTANSEEVYYISSVLAFLRDLQKEPEYKEGDPIIWRRKVGEMPKWNVSQVLAAVKTDKGLLLSIDRPDHIFMIDEIEIAKPLKKQDESK